MYPPFTLTPKILKLSQDIAHEIGLLDGAKLAVSPFKLRRDNKIKTIQSSLAIEGNTLSIDQITHYLDGHHISGPKKDILELKNAIQVYDDLSNWDPSSIPDFQRAHLQLMDGLIDQNGQWRTSGVGVFKGTAIAHMAPPAKHVPTLMAELFAFITHNSTTPWLLKACITHYEIEFIHPFMDGNGRMGRLWQHLLLMKENPVFEYIAVESLIKTHQTDYYDILGHCDAAGDSTAFIEFCLAHLLTTLTDFSASRLAKPVTADDRLRYTKMKMTTWFSRKDYMTHHRTISSATASRDLQQGLADGLLTKKGTHNQIRYKFT